MGIKINEIDYKTINNKNVDFLAIHGDEKIYVEVKGFIPKNDESVDTDESKISKAIVRAVPKFFDTACNILVIADEDTLSPPLFLNPCVDMQRTPEIYLNICDKVSAIIILGGLYEEYLLKFKI
jgi:hypothetical protein